MNMFLFRYGISEAETEDKAAAEKETFAANSQTHVNVAICHGWGEKNKAKK